MKQNIEAAFASIQSEIKTTLMKTVYIVAFILFILLLSLIPFMYITLITPRPMYENAVSTMNMFSLFNIVLFIVISFISFIVAKTSIASRILKLDSINNEAELKNELRQIIKNMKIAKIVSLFLLSFSAFMGFTATFMFVTGPLVLMYPLYFFNSIPVVVLLIYLFLSYPGINRFKKTIDKALQ